jgi:hypothetical protein
VEVIREFAIACVAIVGLVLGSLAYGLYLLWVHRLEAAAAAFGLAGAWLLAAKGEHAAWGWWFFLGSNAGWLAFGWIRRHWFLLLQQVGFTASSVWGIWNWIGVPHG